MFTYINASFPYFDISLVVKLNLTFRDILSYFLTEIDYLPVTSQPGFVEFRFQKDNFYRNFKFLLKTINYN